MKDRFWDTPVNDDDERIIFGPIVTGVVKALNPVTRKALAEAIAADHPCTDYGCDIATALKHGFVEASAHLLMGATETPHVDAVIERYDLLIPGVHSRAFDRWYKFHKANGRQCESCESYMYANPDTGFEPTQCTNCLALLPAREGDKTS